MSDNVTLENSPNTDASIETEPVIPVKKTIPQSVANYVVKQAKHRAYEQSKKAVQEGVSVTTNQYAYFPPTPLTTEDVQSLIANHTSQQASAWQAQQIAPQFLGNISLAKDKYPDFEENIFELRSRKIS